MRKLLFIILLRIILFPLTCQLNQPQDQPLQRPTNMTTGSVSCVKTSITLSERLVNFFLLRQSLSHSNQSQQRLPYRVLPDLSLPELCLRRPNRRINRSKSIKRIMSIWTTWVSKMSFFGIKQWRRGWEHLVAKISSWILNTEMDQLSNRRVRIKESPLLILNHLSSFLSIIINSYFPKIIKPLKLFIKYQISII